MKEEAITKESSSIIVPALISGVVSAGLALLLTPKSGQEMRQNIGRLVKKSSEEASEAIEQGKSAISEAAACVQAPLSSQSQQFEEFESAQGERTSLILPILISGIAGAALALLFAPKSGKELMGDIKDLASTAVDKSKDLYASGVTAVKDALEKGKEAAAETKEKMIRPAA